tara:strand:+ start:20974 stop:23937 length:2964 start_codon:yes stop_codon:yes gene_type:complete
MGFTDNPYISKSVVIPGLLKDPPVIENGFKRAADGFAAVAADLFTQVEAEDKINGTIAGQNSIIVDANGGITRGKIPDNITTDSGRAAFNNSSRTADLNTRMNALRDSASDALLKARKDPQTLQAFGDIYGTISSSLIDNANPDIKNMLGIEAARIARSGINTLTAEIDSATLKSNVKASMDLINNSQSNIVEALRNGNNALSQVATLKANLAQSLAAKFIDQSYHDGQMRMLNVSVISGNLFQEFSKKKDSDLTAFRSETNDLLKGEESSLKMRSNFSSSLALLGIKKTDITEKERASIMSSVDQIINFKRAEANQKIYDGNIALAPSRALATQEIIFKGNNLTTDKVIEIYERLGLTEKIRQGGNAAVTNQFNKHMDRASARTLSEYNRLRVQRLNKLGFEIGISSTQAELTNAGKKAIQLAWTDDFKDDKSGLLSLFKSIESRQIAILKINEETSEKDMKFKISQWANAGTLTQSMIKSMSLDTSTEAKKAISRWMIQKGGMAYALKALKTYDTSGAKGRTYSISAAHTAGQKLEANGSLGITTEGKAAAETLWRQSQDKQGGLYDPAQVGAEAALQNAANFAAGIGIVPSGLKDMLDLGANSNDVEIASRAAAAYAALMSSPKKKSLGVSIGGSLVRKLDAITQHFSGDSKTDQASFAKFLKAQSNDDEATAARESGKLLLDNEEKWEEFVYKHLNSDNTDLFSRTVQDLFGADNDATPSDELVSGGTVNSSVGLTDRKLAKLSPVAMALIRRTFERKRPEYGTGPDAHELALEDTFATLAEHSKFGVSSFAPVSEGQGDGVRLTRNALEAYYTPANSEIIVSHFLKEELSKDTFAIRDLPQGIGEYSIDLKNLFTNQPVMESLIRDGWITLIPTTKSSKVVPDYNLVIADPKIDRKDPRRNQPIVIPFRPDQSFVNGAIMQRNVDNEKSMQERSKIESLGKRIRSGKKAAPPAPKKGRGKIEEDGFSEQRKINSFKESIEEE